MVVGGAKGSQSHTKTLKGDREGDLVEFCSQVVNDVSVIALLSKRGGNQGLCERGLSDAKLNRDVLKDFLLELKHSFWGVERTCSLQSFEYTRFEGCSSGRKGHWEKTLCPVVVLGGKEGCSGVGSLLTGCILLQKYWQIKLEMCENSPNVANHTYTEFIYATYVVFIYLVSCGEASP